VLINHVPFVLDPSRGPEGTLVGHVARANPVWRALTPGGPASVLVFHGPQAYITPAWYPGKAAHGKVVPTWNYAVVHAHGVAHAVHEVDWKLSMLERLSQAHEAAQAQPWQVSDAPADYIDGMLRAIVGIEVPIDRLEAKLKASQDEALPDRLGTLAGLQQSDSNTSRTMGAWVGAALAEEKIADCAIQSSAGGTFFT
jgi:transcriptional regulator